MPWRMRASDIPPPGMPERRRWRRAYFMGNAFEAAIAVASIVAVIVYAVDPVVRKLSSVGHVASTLAPYWTVGYGLAGVLILVGLWKPTPRYELAGLSLLSAAVCINGTAIVIYQGMHAISAAATFLALAAACVCRGWLVWHLAHAAMRENGQDEG